MRPLTLLRRGGRNQSGASALEFALVAPMLLLLIFGLVQLSTALFAYHMLNESLASGARRLYFNMADVEGAKKAVRDAAAAGYLDTRQLTVTSAKVDQPYPHLQLSAVYSFTGIGFGLPQGKLDLRASTSVAITE